MRRKVLVSAIGLLAVLFMGVACATAEEKAAAAVQSLPKTAGKTADMTKPVKVFILLGQSNMVGMGKIGPADKDGTLENAVKSKKKYTYLVDEAGNWTERNDVRFVRYMSGKGPLNNEWMTVKTCRTIGPEFGIGHELGNAIDAPVMILKVCIGNRSLGWDLLPPGSERFVEGDKVYAGYKDKPDSWAVDPAKGKATVPPPFLDKKGNPINWYAGLQYDGDTADAKKALADLEKHYPGAKGFDVAGFFLWQGEKDAGNAVHQCS